MRATKCIVRGYRDRLVVLCVWEVRADSVLVTNESMFACLSSGLPALEPVAFPTDCVFRFSQLVAEQYNGKTVADQSVWRALAPFVDN
jgi:hypothetical protein